MMLPLIHFYRASEPYGCLSNFSPHPVWVDGLLWLTSEHYYQAQKFTDQANRLEVQLAPSPMAAAQIGRDASRPMRPDWDQVKAQVMRKVLWAKVLQHADVREVLLSTGDAILAEHTDKDSYWGDGGDGQGQNVLGKLWMEVRAELTKDGPYAELAQTD